MKKYLVSLVAIILMMAAGTVRAQEQQGQEGQPGVGRVSMIHGDVSTQRGDSADWVAATLNAPIAVGDRVSTGERSRAEVQLVWAHILRMADGATAKIANLTRTKIQVQVGQGLVTYSVLKGSEADTEIDTPNVAIHPLGEGSYRVLVNSDSETQVVLRGGAAEISTPQGSTRVEKGQLITISGTDNAQYQTAEAPGRDDWDKWNNDRDKRINSAQSWRHTDHYYTGSEDLDTYGSWTEVPDYGSVWVPRADPDWAPYRDGRWVWEPYYGWTWTSYEPWGWAPYHYGRWFVYGGNWAWWPGPVVAYPEYYPVWSPAYVSFIGFGYGGGGWGFNAGFGFGGGFGSVGWLPVGPCDPFFPWFGRFGDRVNVVNITNITNITNVNNVNVTNINNGGIAPLAGNRGRQFSNLNGILSNQRIRGGISSMPANQFGKGAVPAHQQAVNEASLRQAKMMTGAVPVTPTRESLRPTDHAVSPSTIRGGASNSQRFFAKAQPAPAPQSFKEQAAQVQRAIRGSTTNTGANAQTSRPAAFKSMPLPGSAVRQQPVIGANKPGGRENASSGTLLRTPSAPPSTQVMSTTHGGTPTAVQTSARPGWHSFQPPQQTTAGGNRPAQMGQRPATNNSPRTPFTALPSHPNQSAPTGGQGGQSAQSGQGGWQQFTPPSHLTQPQPSQRQFQPQTSRGSYSNSNSRPPLDMRQPIVAPRSSSSSGYSAPRGGYSTPSAPRGGGYSIPSAPRGGYSAPSGGSSTPRGGSNGGASGGYRGSAPSGGGAQGGSSGGRPEGNRSR